MRKSQQLTTFSQVSNFRLRKKSFKHQNNIVVESSARKSNAYGIKVRGSYEIVFK